MDISGILNLKIAIWGAAREGLAITKKIFSRNPLAEIIILNDQALTAEQIQDFSTFPVKYATGIEEIEASLKNTEILIKSPGVSYYRPEIVCFKERGGIVTSGTNLWIAEHKSKKILAITGTKGKSTTSSICTEILKAEGLDAVCGGNIGKPLWDLPDNHGYYVLELSSYQITDLCEKVNAACLLNLYPAHQLWHGGEEQYYRDKCRLQNYTDKFCINAADKKVRQSVNNKNLFFYNQAEGFELKHNTIYKNSLPWFECNQMKILGAHNYLNTCAALTLASFFTEITDKSKLALSEFQAISHRLEKVGTFEGVHFINDSISTVPESAIAAIKAVNSENLTLIIGGQDIEGNWQAFYDFIAEKPIHNIITLPDNGEKIISGFKKFLSDKNQVAAINFYSVNDLKEAVSKAKLITPKGGTILLSPGTPSYGRFKNFEERGNTFKHLAQTLNTTPQ